MKYKVIFSNEEKVIARETITTLKGKDEAIRLCKIQAEKKGVVFPLTSFVDMYHDD